MIGDIFAWIIAFHVLAHTLLALIIMALVCPLLQLLRVYAFAWHAAAYTSLFFYAREAAQAERALKPLLGDPAAFFWTLWPGHWTQGGARFTEWLAPTAAVMVVAILTPRRPFLFRPPRDIQLPAETRARGAEP